MGRREPCQLGHSALVGKHHEPLAGVLKVDHRSGLPLYEERAMHEPKLGNAHIPRVDQLRSFLCDLTQYMFELGGQYRDFFRTTKLRERRILNDVIEEEINDVRQVFGRIKNLSELRECLLINHVGFS